MSINVRTAGVGQETDRLTPHGLDVSAVDPTAEKQHRIRNCRPSFASRQVVPGMAVMVHTHDAVNLARNLRI